MRPHRVLLALTLALLASLAYVPTALAHAQLLDTSPQSGSTVAAQPARVIFKFNQAVGGTLGAVRVYDAQGNEVDDLERHTPRRSRALDGRRFEGASARWHLHGHLPRDLH